jgi:hypothetical protein
MRTDQRSPVPASRSRALALAAAALALGAPAASRAVEVVEIVPGARGAPAEVVVLRPAPEQAPARERLGGSDIRTHAFAAPREPNATRAQGWQPGAPSQIPVDDWRTREGGGVPIAGTGAALTSQSWNPSGARYEPSRIRVHDWVRENAVRTF